MPNDVVEVLQQFMAPPAKPLGLVFPPRADAPGLPDKGAREVALRRFCDFLSKLPFRRTMKSGEEPQIFRVPREQIFIDQPESDVGSPDGAPLPTVAFLTSEADETTTGFLGPDVLIEGTEDVFAPDTALFWTGDHTEEVVVEVVAQTRAVRRAIVEGIKQVLRSSDDSGSLRLGLPDYFDQDATFTLLRSSYVQDADAVRNRRRAHLTIQLYVSEVILANAMTLIPFATVVTQSSTVVSTVVSEPVPEPAADPLAFFGVAVDPGVGGYDSAFVASLQHSSDADGPFSYNVVSGANLFFCALSALARPLTDFTVVGFPLACSRVATNVPVVGVGGPRMFDVFRSDFTGLGPLTLEVSP